MSTSLYELNPWIHYGLIVVLEGLYTESGKEGEVPDLGIFWQAL